MPKLHELLGTKNRKDQEQRVQQLLDALNSPILDVLIRYNPRAEDPITHIAVIGGQPPPESIMKILEMTRDKVLQQIISASGPPVMPPDAPPQHPDQPAEDTGEPSQELSAPEVAAE